MVHLLTPNIAVQRIDAIDTTTLRGRDLIVLDLDNTLVFPETCDTLPEIRTWMDKLRSHTPCIIVSNSRTRGERRARIEDLFGCRLLTDAPQKPLRALKRHLVSASGTPNPRIAVIGDRLFVDVLFGKRIGALTVLVQPLSRKERWDIRVIRLLENTLLYLFFR